MNSLYSKLSEENKTLLEKKAIIHPAVYGELIEVLKNETNASELKLGQAHSVWSTTQLKPFDVLEFLELFEEPTDPAQISMEL